MFTLMNIYRSESQNGGHTTEQCDDKNARVEEILIVAIAAETKIGQNACDEL